MTEVPSQGCQWAPKMAHFRALKMAHFGRVSKSARGTPAPGEGAETGMLGRWIVMTGPRSGRARH